MRYYAIIGDIKASRSISERDKVQKKLKRILNDINKFYRDDIAAGFLITLGDEFQGLLAKPIYLLDIIKYIQTEMYPVQLRFGIGIGEITTEINYEAAIGTDGPAYYAARNMIEDIKEQEKKIKRQAADIQISFYDKGILEVEEINTLLVLMKVIEDHWSEKQRYTIWDMIANGGSQEECAKRMNTTQSTVARRLADGNYVIYEKTKRTIKRAIDALGEIK
jgi:hypothetical protein